MISEPKLFPTLLRGFTRLLSGKAVFPRAWIGKILVLPDGRRYRIFRQAILKSQAPSDPQGIFRVWFHSRTSPRFTILYSWLMIPLFLGMPGFRSKLWLVDESSGEFGGIYTWDSVADAARYSSSFAMRLSKMRSEPGKFKGEVFSSSDSLATYVVQF